MTPGERETVEDCATMADELHAVLARLAGVARSPVRQLAPVPPPVPAPAARVSDEEYHAMLGVVDKMSRTLARGLLRRMAARHPETFAEVFTAHPAAVSALEARCGQCGARRGEPCIARRSGGGTGGPMKGFHPGRVFW